MPRHLPPIEHRFPANRPHAPNAGNHGPYLMPLLKRLLEKKINFEDPETKKIIQGKVKHAILWRYILNAAHGENQAIEGIIDRIDGKVAQKLIGEGFAAGESKIILIAPSFKTKKTDASRINTIAI